MRGLKILVVVMGVMLVAGVGLLGAVIAGRVAQSGANTESKRGAAHNFTAPAIEIPRDAWIEAIGTGPDRVVVALTLADGARQLVVIDLASGRKLGTILLHPEP